MGYPLCALQQHEEKFLISWCGFLFLQLRNEGYGVNLTEKMRRLISFKPASVELRRASCQAQAIRAQHFQLRAISSPGMLTKLS